MDTVRSYITSNLYGEEEKRGRKEERREGRRKGGKEGGREGGKRGREGYMTKWVSSKQTLRVRIQSIIFPPMMFPASEKSKRMNFPNRLELLL